jgi:hypothetical protein
MVVQRELTRPVKLPRAPAQPTDYTELLKQIDELDLSIDTDLTAEQQAQVRQFLKDNIRMFAINPSGPPITPVVKHRIDTGTAAPIRVKPYRSSQTEWEIINKHIKEMLKNRVIRHSSSPWAAPVVLAPKADGSLRFCVDYRRLNVVTKKDVYPLPRIEDTLNRMKNMEFYSSIDLASGYWQVEIEESDKEKTAFITTSGLYEFNVMPFGLSNAPATFQRLMDTVLTDMDGTLVRTTWTM